MKYVHRLSALGLGLPMALFGYASATNMLSSNESAWDTKFLRPATVSPEDIDSAIEVTDGGTEYIDFRVHIAFMGFCALCAHTLTVLSQSHDSR